MPHICFQLSGVQTCISKCFLDNIIRMIDLYLGTKLSLSTPNMFFLQSSHLSKLFHHSPNCSFQNLGVIFYSFLSLMSCIQSNNSPVKLRLQNIPSIWPFFYHLHHCHLYPSPYYLPSGPQNNLLTDSSVLYSPLHNPFCTQPNCLFGFSCIWSWHFLIKRRSVGIRVSSHHTLNTF